MSFIPGGRYAITGPNGSGKSTLLQVIAGAVLHSEGDIIYRDVSNQGILAPDKAYQKIAIAAPYLELIEEMNSLEFLAFHATFKKMLLDHASILKAIGLEKAAHKQIRYFSSGMKQRLKIGQAIFCDAEVLLLDEPTTNLDEDGSRLYHELIAGHTAGKTIIVSSNDPKEYSFCSRVISINDYKSS